MNEFAGGTGDRGARQRPVASLLFLRGGDVYTPKAQDLDKALEATHAQVDAGQVVETLSSSAFDDTSARHLDP